ncbi:Uncharacterized protein Rs2_35821 [Raphanus sativus]|nr:Uncharacterized protein Rs2_35821 [Raphanus sativus]
MAEETSVVEMETERRNGSWILKILDVHSMSNKLLLTICNLLSPLLVIGLYAMMIKLSPDSLSFSDQSGWKQWSCRSESNRIAKKEDSFWVLFQTPLLVARWWTLCGLALDEDVLVDFGDSRKPMMEMETERRNGSWILKILDVHSMSNKLLLTICNLPSPLLVIGLYAMMIKLLPDSLSFSHPCLNKQSVLYSPMGELLILQPDESFSPGHHLLPLWNGLYFLTESLDDEEEQRLRAAETVFLNTPHPLDILSDRVGLRVDRNYTKGP